MYIYTLFTYFLITWSGLKMTLIRTVV